MADPAVKLTSNEDLRAQIVHSLRSRGWSREDAIYEADEKLSRRALLDALKEEGEGHV